MPVFDPNSPAASHEALADITAIRTNFQSLNSCEASTSEPSNLVAGKFWYDTTANILKLRNEANTAWQNVWDFGNNRLPLNVLAPGELTADTAGRAKMADLFITNAKVNDVAGSKLTGNAPTEFVAAGGLANGAVNTTAKVADAIITGAKQSKTIVSSATYSLAFNQYWVPPAGFYTFLIPAAVRIWVYMSGGWRSDSSSSVDRFFSGWCDGTNMKLFYPADEGQIAIYYITR